MSHQELRDEQKHTEIDPHLKQSRRERAVAIATNRMLRDVPTADVVITNPTHYVPPPSACTTSRHRRSSAPTRLSPPGKPTGPPRSRPSGSIPVSEQLEARRRLEIARRAQDDMDELALRRRSRPAEYREV
jgi:hypothetical protein